MKKTRHEVRDAIHEFVFFDNLERELIDSQPFQRLRSIHQLAMTHQVYPGATHTRFEHCLGVMELSGRIFDSVFRADRISLDVKDRIGHELEGERRGYWRRVVRLAGLLHDLGHLPFSHAAEAQVLPEGWNHERLTVEFIRKSEIAAILKRERPQVDPDDVVDVAWDVKKRAKVKGEKTLDPWMTLLNELICGDVFGADRIDYLLRDSYHAGVAYGRFDPSRLIDGLRVVVDPAVNEVAFGLEANSIHSAEALLLARYFMYTQVYFHDVRRAYDQHLIDYMKAWLPEGRFPTDWKMALKITDDELLAGLRLDLADDSLPNHELALRLGARQHFRTVYELTPAHFAMDKEIFSKVFNAVETEVGPRMCRQDQYRQKEETDTFPVVLDTGTSMTNANTMSAVLRSIPPLNIGLVFVHPESVELARKAVDSVLRDCENKAKEKEIKHEPQGPPPPP